MSLGACGTLDEASKRAVFETQADETLTETPPVSGTTYGVLATSLNARIIAATCSVTWTVQPDPLELHFVIDGITYTASFTNPVSTTVYHAVHNPIGEGDILSATEPLQRSHLRDAKTVAIGAETTGGTVQNLSARVKYGLLR